MPNTPPSPQDMVDVGRAIPTAGFDAGDTAQFNELQEATSVGFGDVHAANPHNFSSSNCKSSADRPGMISSQMTPTILFQNS
jgi:hypothetical protein